MVIFKFVSDVYYEIQIIWWVINGQLGVDNVSLEMKLIVMGRCDVLYRDGLSISWWYVYSYINRLVKIAIFWKLKFLRLIWVRFNGISAEIIIQLNRNLLEQCSML